MYILSVSNIVSFVLGIDGVETEKTLVKYIPGELLPIAHHWLILHGRYVCKARKPDCLNCGIREWCKSFKKEYSSKRI